MSRGFGIGGRLLKSIWLSRLYILAIDDTGCNKAGDFLFVLINIVRTTVASVDSVFWLQPLYSEIAISVIP